MLRSEFTELTGIKPTCAEYCKIEEAYYEADVDKRTFCKDFMANNGMLKIQRELYEGLCEEYTDQGEQIDKAAAKIVELEAQIASLKAQLEREQEWRPWTDKNAVPQSEYDALLKTGREMTDEEAKDWIATEFGFDPAKILINRFMNTYDVNRHHQLRKSGEIQRDPIYDATDYYYVFFTVCGSDYEAFNGTFSQI